MFPVGIVLLGRESVEGFHLVQDGGLVGGRQCADAVGLDRTAEKAYCLPAHVIEFGDFFGPGVGVVHVSAPLANSVA
jgi:hypothetical protein